MKNTWLIVALTVIVRATQVFAEDAASEYVSVELNPTWKRIECTSATSVGIACTTEYIAVHLSCEGVGEAQECAGSVAYGTVDGNLSDAALRGIVPGSRNADSEVVETIVSHSPVGTVPRGPYQVLTADHEFNFTVDYQVGETAIERAPHVRRVCAVGLKLRTWPRVGRVTCIAWDLEFAEKKRTFSSPAHLDGVLPFDTSGGKTSIELIVYRRK